MKGEKLRIKENTLFQLLLLFPFLEPDSFRVVPIVHFGLRGCAVISILLMCLIYLKGTIKKTEIPSFPLVLLLIYGGWLCYVSTLSLGNLPTTITNVVPIIGVAMWADIFAKQGEGIKPLIHLIMLYIYINLATLLLFPNGLYQSQSYQAVPYICYFLGYRNVQSLWLLPALALVLWDNYCTSSTLLRKTKIRLSAIMLTIVMIKSSTTYVAAAIFVAAFIIIRRLSRNRYLWGVLNLSTVYLGSLAVSVGLIFFDIQYRFSFIIENILHKELDLTDRIYVWEKALLYIRNAFWTGYGYIYDPTSRALIGASHPHNYSLNLLYSGGIIGFVMVSLVWLIIGKRTKCTMNNLASRSLFLGCVVLLLIGLTEPLKQLPTAYLLLFIFLHENRRIMGKEVLQ